MNLLPGSYLPGFLVVSRLVLLVPENVDALVRFSAVFCQPRSIYAGSWCMILDDCAVNLEKHGFYGNLHGGSVVPVDV